MKDTKTLRQEIKRLMVENLMLQVTDDDIGDDQALFGPDGLGLDSVDALQIVVGLDKHYGLKIPDQDTARGVLRSVATIADAVQGHLQAAAAVEARRGGGGSEVTSR